MALTENAAQNSMMPKIDWIFFISMVFGSIHHKSVGPTPGSLLSMIHVYIPEAKSTQFPTTMESEKKLREGLYEPVAVYFAENDAIISFDDMEEILDSVVKHLDDLIPNYFY